MSAATKAAKPARTTDQERGYTPAPIVWSACPHCGQPAPRSVRGRPDGHLVTVCEHCGRDVEDLGIFDEHLRAAERRRNPGARFASLAAAIAWYVRTQTRMEGTRSLDDVLAERLAYGVRIDGGEGSTRDGTLLQLARIQACLPDVCDGDGHVVLEAVIARAMLLLTCAGARGEGMGREAAAERCRARFGPEWTEPRCRALLFRAQAETRARLQVKGILRRGWGR
jgi:hypothetical protein